MHQEARLELADVIRSTLYVARSRKDEATEAEARSLLRRLAGEAFSLAVVGLFSRGKSTLMNAILGAGSLR